MEDRLDDHPWLAAEHLTIADVACYPYVSVAEEGRFSLEPYPAVSAWLKRFEGTPGWIPLPSWPAHTLPKTP